ncbi:uncharacterized protein LOC129943845 [Eupeodes corollae]|uniref:uncharacterized protein LOC129943845 n=1 Tax=Eupeodes corollae TaxID=290404 RepID=UPI002491F037|nr:uncharacterized protein LOC129943845 [Eupeodes corollae]
MELSTRAAYRGQVTRLVNSALEFLKDDRSRVNEENEPNFSEIEEELVTHLQRLTSAHDNLNAINEEIKQKSILKEDELQKCVDYQDLALRHLKRLLVCSKSDMEAPKNSSTIISSSYCTRSLTALQVPTSNYYVMLRSILLRCLPTALRIEYHRQEESAVKEEESNDTSSNNGSALSHIGGSEVKDIFRFLKREVESLEKSGVTHTNSKVRTVAQSTASSLVTINEVEVACIFCKMNNHKTKDCDSNILNIKFCGVAAGVFVVLKLGILRRNAEAKTMQESDDKSKTSALNVCSHNTTESVLLKTVRCAVASTKTKISISAIIDGGSQHTYVRESVAKKLKLKVIGTVDLSVIPFGCKEAKPMKTFNKVKINLKSLFSHEVLVTLEAIVVPEICVDVLMVPEAKCPLFEGIQLSDVRPNNMEFEEGLSLLIGSDYNWSIVTGKQRQLTKRLRAVETVFGWTLQGVHSAVSDEPDSSYKNSCFSSRCLINLTSAKSEELTQFWSLEAIGIRNNEDENMYLTENLIDKCITRQGSRYVAKLPWKAYDSILQDNKGQALQRLNSLIRRLSRDPAKLLNYDEAIRKLICDGVAQAVTSSCQKECYKSRVFYLPHQPVYKEAGTTKLRVVFDASAHIDGTGSLNDHLWTGANLLPDVMKILLNFRLGLHGIVADIEKAFLQIVLSEEDRDSHRFIWFGSKLTSAGDRPKFAEHRMTRVTFGVNCSPFLLCATINYHLKLEAKGFPETCAILLESIYMDDLVISTDSEKEGSSMCSEAVDILKRASLNLHKWNSSSQVIQDVMNVNNAPSMQKVLGLLVHIQ